MQTCWRHHRGMFTEMHYENKKYGYAGQGQLNSCTHLRVLLVLRGMFWLRQLATRMIVLEVSVWTT
jgi:hypothetical protein